MPKVPHEGRGQRRPRRKRSERLPHCKTIVVAGVGDGDEDGIEETGIGRNLPPATRTTMMLPAKAIRRLSVSQLAESGVGSRPFGVVRFRTWRSLGIGSRPFGGFRSRNWQSL